MFIFTVQTIAIIEKIFQHIKPGNIGFAGRVFACIGCNG